MAEANNSLTIDPLPSQAALDLASSIWSSICDAHDQITVNDALEINANIAGMLVASVIGSEFRRLAADDYRSRIEQIMDEAVAGGDKQEGKIN